MAVVALGSTGCGTTLRLPPPFPSASAFWEFGSGSPGLAASPPLAPVAFVAAVAAVSARWSGVRPGRDETEPRCLTDAYPPFRYPR
jgi:hypothetical protein